MSKVTASPDTGSVRTNRATVQGFRALDSPMLPAPKAMCLQGAEGMIDYPIPCFLIEHERGLMMVDTGLDPAAIDDPLGTYGDHVGQFVSGHLRAEHSIELQLSKLGYTLSDIDIAVVTHLHFDHAGGMPLFPRARFIGGVGEIQGAFWPDPATLAAGYYNLNNFGFLREDPTRWIEVGPADHDVFGDGSVILFHLPGHTPGQLAVLVHTPERSFLLASDVLHLCEGFGGLRCPSDWDPRQAARSVGRLQELARAFQADVWISHDPRDWNRFAGKVYR